MTTGHLIDISIIVLAVFEVFVIGAFILAMIADKNASRRMMEKQRQAMNDRMRNLGGY